jgi:nucleoside-diphosphate-sugar epimerase
MKPRVLITGCSGEIGSRVTKLLLQSGFHVHGFHGSKQCHINNSLHTCNSIDFLKEDAESLLSGLRPDVLIHTAWITKPGEFWNSPLNLKWVDASKKLISSFEKMGGKYIAVTGSCAEYSWHSLNPLSENTREDPENEYGKSKLELLNWLRSRNLEFLWTRTFFQYGLSEPKGRLIPSLIDALLEGNSFSINNPMDARDFIFVEDVARILSILIERNHHGIVNLGTGSEINIGELGAKIGNLMKSDELVLLKNTSSPITKVVSDPTKLTKLIGHFEWTTLDRGLHDTISARGSLNRRD